MKKEFTKIWHRPNSAPCAMAVNEHMITATVVNLDSMEATLVYCGFEDGILHSIPLGSYLESTWPACILHEGSLYVTRQDFTTERAEVVRFATHIPSARQPHVRFGVSRCETVNAFVPRDSAESATALSLGYCNLRLPTYGVLDVTTRSMVEDQGDTESHYVHFWPVDTSRGTLELGPLVYHRHSGNIHSLHVGSAGTRAVVWNQDHFEAALVRYVVEPGPHTTVHLLDLSAVDFDTRRIPIFELDDRRGVLYVRDRDEACEVLSIVSYV
jgi:hypothetical protein